MTKDKELIVVEKEFIEFVADVIGVDPSEISMETEYGSSGWDSLMMLTLVMEVEAEFGTMIPIERLQGIRTLADLYAFVGQSRA